MRFLPMMRGVDGEIVESKPLCRTAEAAAIALRNEPARHSPQLGNAIRSACPDAEVVGGMYWRHIVPPRSALQAIRDWVLDIGAPSRTHRHGVFDGEFTHVGTAMQLRGDGSLSALRILRGFQRRALCARGRESVWQGEAPRRLLLSRSALAMKRSISLYLAARGMRTSGIHITPRCLDYRPTRSL